MGLSIETLQNIILSSSNETLQSYTDKINRRLAVLANLGQRFGQEGQGFYIDQKSFLDIISINIPEEYLAVEKRVCVTLSLEDYESNSLSELSENSISVQCKIEDTWQTIKFSQDISIQYPPFFKNLFNAYALFVSTLYTTKKDQYFRKVVSTQEGIEIEENLTSCTIVFNCDSRFDVIYDSSSNLPICFSQPYCISSDQFYSEDLTPLFTAKFTTALNVEEIVVDPDLKEEIGKFFVVEYGIGIKDTGEILFNGLNSDIVIDGADGDNALVYIIKGDVKEEQNYPDITIVSRIQTATIYGPQGLREANNYALVDTYISSAGKIAYYIEPDIQYFNNNGNFTEGAIAFCFLSIITPQNDTFNVSTILIYTNNQWEPLGVNSKETPIFTFYDLVDSVTIEKNIRKRLGEYFSGEKPDEEEQYFKHKQVIFKDSKLTYVKDKQFDAMYYRMPGNYILSTYKTPDTYNQDFNTGVLNINYALQSIPEDLSNRLSITFEDMILKSQFTLKRNRPRLFYNQEQYNNEKVSYELPTIALNNTSLFMPSIVDELRVYNIWDKETPKAGWSEDSDFGIPEVKLTGNKLTFGELEYEPDTLVYTPVAVAEMSEQWNTSIASQKYTERTFTFKVQKNETRYPLEITVNNILYHDLNTLVLVDDFYLENSQGKRDYPERLEVTKKNLTYYSEEELEENSPVSYLDNDTTKSSAELSSKHLKFVERSDKMPEAKIQLELDHHGITINRNFEMKMENNSDKNIFINIQKRKFVLWSEPDHQNHHNDTEEIEIDPGVGYWRYPLTDIFSEDYVKYDSSESGDADLLKNRSVEIAPCYNGLGRDEVFRVNLYEAVKREYIQRSDIVFNGGKLSYFYYPCINNIPVSHKSSMWVEWNLK